MSEVLLKVENLKKYFPVNRGFVLERTVAQVRAVDGIDFAINPGETFGLVGESGCGKSTTGLLVLRLLDPTSGSIWFGGNDIAKLKGPALRQYRESIQAIFQDPYSSLDPRMKIRRILAEPLIINRQLSRDDVNEMVAQQLSQVGLDKQALDLYPHEFSGGQRQRIALARSLILRPKLVVLDEPVSALDVSTRAQIMNDLKDLQMQLGVAYLLIAHNLDTVRYMSHWVGVMYLGKLVEWAPCEELFTHPLHPYTQALLSAALPSHPSRKRQEIVLTGEVPSPVNIAPGCRFNPRCFRTKGSCFQDEPHLIEVSPKHFVACNCE